MTNLEYGLGFLLIAAVVVIAFLASERKGLKQALDQARADRSAAYVRNSQMHAQHVEDIEASTARLRDMTDQLRKLTDTTTKEI